MINLKYVFYLYILVFQSIYTINYINIVHVRKYNAKICCIRSFCPSFVRFPTTHQIIPLKSLILEIYSRGRSVNWESIDNPAASDDYKIQRLLYFDSSSLMTIIYNEYITTIIQSGTVYTVYTQIKSVPCPLICSYTTRLLENGGRQGLICNFW